ncbi:MAG: peptidase domain-containing ABC transporter [Geitlerinemataceae cyanobacterium]
MPKYAWIRQQSGADCGAASLAIVTKHHGRTFKISRLREVLGTGKGGTTLLQLKEGAQKLGFWAQVFQVKPEKLDELMAKAPLPAILYWRGYHFVALFAREGDRYVVSDPGMGVRRLSRQELLDGWQGGIMLLLTPQPFLFYGQQADAVNPWRSAWQRVAPQRWAVAGILALGFVAGLLGLAAPLFLQVSIDRLTSGDFTTDGLTISSENLAVLALAFAGMQGLRGVAVWAQRWLATRFADRLQTGLKLDFGQQVLHLSLAYYEARYSSITSGVLRDIGAIANTFNQIVVTLPGQTWAGLAGLACLGIYSPWLLGVAIALGALTGLVTAMLHPKIRQQSYQRASLAGKNLFLLSETFRNALTLKTLGAASHLEAELGDRLEREAALQSQNERWANLNQSLSEGLSGLTSVVLVAVAGWLYLRGQLSLGQLAATYGVGLLVQESVTGWVAFWLNFTQVQTAAQLLDELFESRPENLGDADKQERAIAPDAAVRFENLAFAYSGSPPLFADLSVTVPGGKIVAIIGSSGCGKSTLAKLLTRMYDATEGTIAIGDTPATDFPLDCLRRQTVLVPQKAEFLTRSVADNLRLAKADATLKEMQNACELADAHDFIATFTEGYDKTLGPFSANLSSGQKQRIALARALLLEPPILILDEATANLDPPTEKRVMDRVLASRRGRTTILISHRPNTIERAEWIVWLEAGEVKFSGAISEFRQQPGAQLGFLNP